MRVIKNSSPTCMMNKAASERRAEKNFLDDFAAKKERRRRMLLYSGCCAAQISGQIAKSISFGSSHVAIIRKIRFCN